MLDIENVSFGYSQASGYKLVLDDINYKFESGVFYTILGESGSGKTTLMSLLSALDVPESGSIKYEGESLNRIGLHNYRKNHIGLVFQNFNLVPYLSGLQNVLLAMSITNNEVGSNADALSLLESLGIDKSKANRSVNRLSGGEQQRVAIARALSTNVNIILADEPTGNLDKKNQREIIKLFQKMAHEQNKCVIVVTHSNEVAKQSDIVLKMEDNQLTQK